MWKLLRWIQLLVLVGGNIYLFLFVTFSGGFVGPRPLVKAAWIAALVAGVLLLAAAFLLPQRYAAITLVLTLFSLFAPVAAKWYGDRDSASRQAREAADLKRQRVEAFEEFEREAEIHLTERRPLTEAETLDAITAILDAEPFDRGRATFEQLIAAKLVDPNVRVHGAEYNRFDGQPVYSFVYMLYGPYSDQKPEARRRMRWLLESMSAAGANRESKDFNGQSIGDYLRNVAQ